MAGVFRIVLVCAGLAMVTAPAAHAQETLTAGSPTAEWSGFVLFGIAGYFTSYDDHEIKLGESGALEAEVTSTGPGVLELDIHIVIPDPTGGFDDQIVATGTGPLPKVSVSGLAAGGYVVRVQGNMNAPANFDAKATLIPGPATRPAPRPPGASPAPTATPSPTATPQPTPTPEPAGPVEDLSDKPPTASVAKLASRAKALKRISGTAADDKGVQRVDLALVRRRGRTCTSMAPNFTFKPAKDCADPASFLIAKGTSKWSLTLRRRLAAGGYTLFVRAIDSANATSITRKSFKLR